MPPLLVSLHLNILTLCSSPVYNDTFLHSYLRKSSVLLSSFRGSSSLRKLLWSFCILPFLTQPLCPSVIIGSGGGGVEERGGWEHSGLIGVPVTKINILNFENLPKFEHRLNLMVVCK